MTPTETATLEALIDRYGLQDVLANIAMVCDDKATHVAHSWQDASLAKVWLKAALQIDKLADSDYTRAVS